MHDLISLGIRQGTVLNFNQSLSSVGTIGEEVKTGRFGLYSDEGIGPSNILLVLTQECGIASRDTIEIVQGKKERKFKEDRFRHLLDAQDYSKLVIKVGDNFYSFKESLLSKIKQELLFDAIKQGEVNVGEQIKPWQKRRLLDWRRLEYSRAPFPDKFNRAFKQYIASDGQWFSDFLEENQDNIDSVRVYIAPEDEENAEQYSVSFCGLLTDMCNEEKANEISELFERMLKELNNCAPFLNPLQLDAGEDGIELPDTVTLALIERYDEFTFSNAYSMKEFNLEFLCY